MMLPGSLSWLGRGDPLPDLSPISAHGAVMFVPLAFKPLPSEMSSFMQSVWRSLHRVHEGQVLHVCCPSCAVSSMLSLPSVWILHFVAFFAFNCRYGEWNLISVPCDGGLLSQSLLHHLGSMIFTCTHLAAHSRRT